MTDSKGPYKISHNGDWWDVNGPGLPISVPFRSKENAERYAKDKYQEWSVIHHTARREAIEACIATMEAEAARRFPLGMDSCVPLRGACWYMVDAVRALLGAGENKQAEEPDRGDE